MFTTGLAVNEGVEPGGKRRDGIAVALIFGGELEFAAKLAALDAVADQLAVKEDAGPTGPTDRASLGKPKRRSSLGGAS